MNFYEFNEKLIEEGWARNLAAGGVIGASALAGAAGYQNIDKLPFMGDKTKQVSTVDNKLEAVKKVLSFISKRNTNQEIDFSNIRIEYKNLEEVLAPLWGNKWEKVKERMIRSQSDIDPNDPYIDSIPKASELNKKTYVVYVNPGDIGIGSAGATGTYMRLPPNSLIPADLDGIVLVDPNADKFTLRHELTHSIQGIQPGETLANKPNVMFSREELNQINKLRPNWNIHYSSSPHELMVRLAEAKRNYYQDTGKIVDSSTESIREFLTHLFDRNNQNKYSSDAFDLVYIFRALRMVDSDNYYERFRSFIRNYIDKVAKIDQQDKNVRFS